MLSKFILSVFLIFYFNHCFAVEKITILGLFKNKAIVNLDGKQRVLTVGNSSPEGVVLISADSEKAILEVNGIRNIYTLSSHIASQFSGPKGKKTVSIAPDNQGMYLVNGSINNFQVRFVVDTGASLISMNKHQAKRIGLDYKMDGNKSLTNTASGLDVIYIVDLKKVKIGDIEVNNIKGAVHDGDFPKVILLGNTFLNRVDINRNGKLLQLQKD